MQKGDRVALVGPNCPQWIIAFFGVLKAGGIVVQTNPMYVERELEDLFNDSGAETVVVYEPLLPPVIGIPDTYRGETVKAYGLHPTTYGDFYLRLTAYDLRQNQLQLTIRRDL